MRHLRKIFTNITSKTVSKYNYASQKLKNIKQSFHKHHIRQGIEQTINAALTAQHIFLLKHKVHSVLLL